MKNRILFLFMIFVGVVTCSCLRFSNLIQKTEVPTEETVCPSLPDNFTESDLVGTWIAEYFGGDAIDKIIIRADKTYKQIYKSDWLNFESDEKKWRVEYKPNGLALLHLEGMRRCDDLESICNNPGGGLPSDEVAINQCDAGYVDYSGEVILFVTGYAHNVPRGIVLRHPRLAGSDWTYSFKLDESLNP